MMRVTAPGRLHFGLLSVPVAGDPDPPARLFGGVGLMIEEPSVRLTVSRAKEWSATGPEAQRALGFARTFATSSPDLSPHTIEVECCPEPHAGLGSGTALALAVAKALAVEAGYGDWPATELAVRVGRGLRSAVGVHGFERGGLIVEAGKLPGEAVAPLVGHYEFPAEWRIMLARPAGAPAWHGARERGAFARLGRNNPTDALCRIVLTGMLPALAGRDLDAFGEALHEYNARAGEAFAAEQGGSYADPAVAELVGLLRRAGVKGVGQSSWGPTVFAVLGDEGKVRTIRDLLGGAADGATVCPGSRYGARLERQ
jgi:beta-ribofuranosylaminobenzene 5'-phosphate synthase